MPSSITERLSGLLQIQEHFSGLPACKVKVTPHTRLELNQICTANPVCKAQTERGHNLDGCQDAPKTGDLRVSTTLLFIKVVFEFLWLSVLLVISTTLPTLWPEYLSFV
jgi:hypothetical protein